MALQDAPDSIDITVHLLFDQFFYPILHLGYVYEKKDSFETINFIYVVSLWQ